MHANEKKEILELKNYFVSMQSVKMVMSETNSQLIGQVLKFDPSSSARQPSPEILQNLRELNNDCKLGQLLCRSRDPDYLLMIVKRQNSMLNLSWLSTLFDTNSSYWNLMPVQCICEFMWNLFNSNEDASKNFQNAQMLLIVRKY